MNVKISVIIPCYNVEKYIETCLESVLSQTYLNWEAVIVDDGSTDRTGVIADNYSSSDDRFRVFHKSNGGLADARNFGLSRATGEYLLFLDSDDFLMPGAMRALAECAAHGNSDIVVGDFVHVDEKGIVPDAIIVQEDLSNHAISQTGKKTLQDIYASKYHGLNLAAWGKLFRCCLFSEHNIAFPKGKVHEDIATTYKTVCRARTIIAIDEVLYCYREREGSITKRKDKRAFQDCFASHLQRYNELLLYGYSKERLEPVIVSQALIYLIVMEPSDEELYLKAAEIVSGYEGIPHGLKAHERNALRIWSVNKTLFHNYCRDRGLKVNPL